MAGLAANPLSFAGRFERDPERIEVWYLRKADERVADEAKRHGQSREPECAFVHRGFHAIVLQLRHRVGMD